MTITNDEYTREPVLIVFTIDDGSFAESYFEHERDQDDDDSILYKTYHYQDGSKIPIEKILYGQKPKEEDEQNEGSKGFMLNMYLNKDNERFIAYDKEMVKIDQERL